MKSIAASAALAAALLGTLAPDASFAVQTEVRAANQMESYYDTALKESVVDDRLDLDLRYDRFSAGVVFLAHDPSNPQFLDPNGFGFRTEGIRKRWVAATHGPLNVRLGDSYATFGSGLVLRIYEDQAVDFDNVVDGAHVGAALGRWALEGIAGTNSLGEARTMVKGLSSRFDAGRSWTLGLNGAVVDSVSGEASSPGRDEIGGAQANGTLPGDVSLTAEYAVRHYMPERQGRSSPADGHGGYAALSGTRGPLTLLFEGKDLLRFRHAYAVPPTVIPQHATTLLNRGSHTPNINLDDERGYQAEAIVALGGSMNVTGNHSAWEARHAALPGWEDSGQFETDALGSHWILHAAESEQRFIQGDHRQFEERITAGGNWARPIGGWSLELGYETQGVQSLNLARRRLEPPREYRDHIASVTLGRSPRHSWAAMYEWTTDPLAIKDHWLWVEWNIRMGVLGQLSVAGGSLRGGQVCSGGVCKLVSPFQGGRIEVLTNF